MTKLIKNNRKDKPTVPTTMTVMHLGLASRSRKTLDGNKTKIRRSIPTVPDDLPFDRQFFFKRIKWKWHQNASKS